MKQKKNTGALVVSLLLAAVLIGMYLGVAIKLGVTAYKSSNGQTNMGTVQQEPEDPDSIACEDELPAEEPAQTPAQEVEPTYPTRVEFEKITGDDYNMYAQITGYFEDGSLWQYYTPAYPVTELDPVEEILDYGDTFIFCAGGRVIALDTATGQEKWVNEDFNGYSPVWKSDAQRTFYLSGFYGPDLHVIDADGNTLVHVDQLAEGYMWPVGVEQNGDKVTVIFSMSPEGEGMYPVDYNLTTGQVTTPFVPDVQEDLEWIDAYRIFLNREDTNYQRGYALVYLDEDDIPELCAQNNENGVLVIYDEGTDSVKTISYEGGEICYYSGAGVISANTYEEFVSEETFYTYKDGAIERIGTAKMRHYDDGEKEPDCWWEGESIPINDFYKKLNTFRPTSVRSDYATTYPKQMLLAQLDCWHDPAQNIYWNWQEEYLEAVRRSMERKSTFALVDVDENGVPELFTQYEDDNGEVYVQMQTFNAQTHQNTYNGFSGDNMAYIPGTGIVTDSYIYNNEYCTDYIYQVTGKTVLEVAYGDRHLHADGGQTCYLNGSNVSQTAYEQEMAPLYDERAVRIEDLLMSAEEILTKLK